MATSGRKSKVDLFVEVPAAGRHFLHTVEIAPSSSTTVGAAHVNHEQLAQALVEGKLLPPEARYQFLREDGSPIENRLTEMVPGEGAILRLTRAPDVRPPGREGSGSVQISTYLIVVKDSGGAFGSTMKDNTVTILLVERAEFC